MRRFDLWLYIYIGDREEKRRENSSSRVVSKITSSAHTWDLGFLGISEGMRKHKAIDASAAPWEAQRAGREKYVNSPRCLASLFTIWWEKNFHTEERWFRDVCIVLLFKPPTLYAQWIYLWYLENARSMFLQIHRAKNFTCAHKVHPERSKFYLSCILKRCRTLFLVP